MSLLFIVFINIKKGSISKFFRLDFIYVKKVKWKNSEMAKLLLFKLW